MRLKTVFLGSLRALVFCGILMSTPARAAELDPKSIYHSQSRWTTQEGRPLALRDLVGEPVVVAMLYTSCQAACPMIISDLKKIEAGLPADSRSRIRFLALSFDPVRDTPKKLKETMERQSLDASWWTFARGDAAGVREAAALLGIRYKPLEGGDFDHSNVITILDQKGVIAHQQIGLRREPGESIEVLTSLLGGRAK